MNESEGDMMQSWSLRKGHVFQGLTGFAGPVCTLAFSLLVIQNREQPNVLQFRIISQDGGILAAELELGQEDEGNSAWPWIEKKFCEVEEKEQSIEMSRDKADRERNS